MLCSFYARMERNYTDLLRCSKETKERIMKDCVLEFKSHHPDFADQKISQGFILNKISRFYLEHE